jgi:hypothetical protein
MFTSVYYQFLHALIWGILSNCCTLDMAVLSSLEIIGHGSPDNNLAASVLQGPYNDVPWAIDL